LAGCDHGSSEFEQPRDRPARGSTQTFMGIAQGLRWPDFPAPPGLSSNLKLAVSIQNFWSLGK
jgi:hypothetical protein